NFEVTGDIRTTGSPGLTIGGATRVGQSLHVAHTLNVLDVLTVGLDAIINTVTGDQPATIAHDLHTTNCGSGPGNVAAHGSCTTGAVQFDARWDCNTLVQIAALVTYSSNPAHNDNALIGLDPAVYASAAAAPRLELPCGYYYLTAINGSSERVVGVHGRTA